MEVVDLDTNKKIRRRTMVGTDIDEVKRLNSQSGLSYNEVKALLVSKMIKK